ncbi:hypothetical protein Tco_0997458 [Tanacetum coccineum]
MCSPLTNPVKTCGMIYIFPRKKLVQQEGFGGRVSRWAIDLGEHEIEFKPRNEVKEQILADFLAETLEGEDDKEKEPSEKEKGSIWKSVTRSFTHMERQSKMAPEGTNTC